MCVHVCAHRNMTHALALPVGQSSNPWRSTARNADPSRNYDAFVLAHAFVAVRLKNAHVIFTGGRSGTEIGLIDIQQTAAYYISV